MRDTEKTLLETDLPLTFTGGANLRLRTSLNPAPIAGIAAFIARNLDLRLSAEDRFIKFYVKIVTQTLSGPAGGAPAGTGSPEYFTEKIAEDVTETAPVEIKTAAHLLLQTIVTILIIEGPFLSVRQDAVSFAQLLEFNFSLGIAGILIRMILKSHLPVSFFYLDFGSIDMYLQHFIVIPFLRHVRKLLLNEKNQIRVKLQLIPVSGTWNFNFKATKLPP